MSENEKKVEAAAAPKKPGFFKRVAAFFAKVGKKIGKFCSNTFHEMKKVTWTSATELKKSSLLVIVVVVVIAAVIAVIDLAFSSAIQGIAGLIG